MDLIEKTGDKFNLEKYLQAQILCREVVEIVASKVEAGMNEKDGQALVKDEFKKIGVRKFWHPTKFRIGPDTLKNFSIPGDPEIKIKSGEAFFADVGPVIEDHESDFGRTFIYEAGKNPEINLHLLAEASLQVWKETALAWKSEELTGEQLLEQAQKFANKLGYALNPAMAGHRLGDFPHAIFSKTKLFSFKKKPVPNLWVLEIHLIDHESQRGAFFEDILLN